MGRILLVAFVFTLDLYGYGQSDQEIQTDVEHALRAYSISPIQSSVQDGTVILTGSVNLLQSRLRAIQTVRRIHGVKNVQDHIEISVPPVPDTELKAEVNQLIAGWIRFLGGFGNGSISARVKEGTVALFGSATPELTEPVIDGIAGMIGVRDGIDHVHSVPAYERQWRSDFPGFPGKSIEQGQGSRPVL